MPPTCQVRPVLPEDLPELVEADARWNEFYDPDLDRTLTPSWSLDENLLLDFVRQFDDGGRQDTRVFVVERHARAETAETDDGERAADEAEAEAEPEVVGGFGYLLEDDEYSLAFVCLKEDAVAEGVAAVAEHFRRKLRQGASGGGKRRVRLVVRDTDKNLRKMWPAWRAQQYRIRLVPDFFRDTNGCPQDGWELQFGHRN